VVTGEVILQRFVSGHAYLTALRRSSSQRWVQQYERFEVGKLTLEEAMALCHPGWLPAERWDEVYGPRSFPGVASGRCEASRLWGYECDLAPEGTFHADHVFPRSFGGPTRAVNRLVLCPTHNAIKGPDVHVYPWEQGEPVWMRELLERCAEFIE
jgi:hypothetical protein